MNSKARMVLPNITNILRICINEADHRQGGFVDYSPSTMFQNPSQLLSQLTIAFDLRRIPDPSDGSHGKEDLEPYEPTRPLDGVRIGIHRS